MDAGRHDLPNDIEALKAALAAERDRRIIAEAKSAVAKARCRCRQGQTLRRSGSDRASEASNREAEAGSFTERGRGRVSSISWRLQLEELETAATEDEIAAEYGRGQDSTKVAAFTPQAALTQAIPRPSAA